MEFFQETGSTPLTDTLLNISSKASRLGGGSCARISEVMVSSPGLVIFLHLDNAIRKELLVNGSLKGWSSAGSCPPWSSSGVLIFKGGFALLELIRMTTVAADARKILPKELCFLLVGCVVDIVLLQRWNCWSGSCTGHFPQRSQDLPELRPVIQART